MDGWSDPAASLAPPTGSPTLSALSSVPAPAPAPPVRAPLTAAQAAEIEQLLLLGTDARELGLVSAAQQQQQQQQRTQRAADEIVPVSLAETRRQAQQQQQQTRSQRSLNDLYALKRIRFRDGTVRIVTQNANGPCALIAIGTSASASQRVERAGYAAGHAARRAECGQTVCVVVERAHACGQDVYPCCLSAILPHPACVFCRPCLCHRSAPYPVCLSSRADLP